VSSFLPRGRANDDGGFISFGESCGLFLDWDDGRTTGLEEEGVTTLLLVWEGLVVVVLIVRVPGDEEEGDVIVGMAEVEIV
jgi:hypothetical protein